MKSMDLLINKKNLHVTMREMFLFTGNVKRCSLSAWFCNSIHGISSQCEYKIFPSRLKKRIDGREIPLIHVVDMKENQSVRTQLLFFRKLFSMPLDNDFIKESKVFFSLTAEGLTQLCYVPTAVKYKVAKIAAFP